MIYVAIATGVLTFSAAVGAIRATRLLAAALWLAFASAMLSVLLYSLGAHEVAVIELGVGAGLVTVLFVFSLNLVGEERLERRAVLPRSLVWASVILVVLQLAWLIFQASGAALQVSEPSFSIVLWQNRGLDMLVQIPLLFAAALGVLGLLAEAGPAQTPAETQINTAPEEDQPEPLVVEELAEELTA